MPNDESIQSRFNDLRQRARRGNLAPEEQAEYDDVKDRFARALCASQNVLLEPGQVARASFCVAVLYKVRITLDRAVHRTVTVDVSGGGFSTLLGAAAAPGSVADFTLRLSTKDAVAGRAIVASAEKERTGNLYRVAFAFDALGGAEAALLEEALFDAVVLRRLTPPTSFVVAPRAAPPTRARPEVSRPSTPAHPLRAPIAAPPVQPTPTASVPPADRGSHSRRTASPSARGALEGSVRAKSVDELLDEAMSEVCGESEAARREKVSVPRLAAPPAQSAAANVDAPRPPLDTPFALMSSMESLPHAPVRSRGRHVASRALRVAGAVVGSVLATALAWRLVLAPRGAVSAVAASPPAPPSASAPVAPARAGTSTAAARAATPAAPAPASTLGTVDVRVAGRRVFLDGRLVGEGPHAFSVACGRHEVRVGSHGAKRALDVPCGGEIVVAKP